MFFFANLILYFLNFFLVELHNLFIKSILNNAYHGQAVPPIFTGGYSSAQFQKKNLYSSSNIKKHKKEKKKKKREKNKEEMTNSHLFSRSESSITHSKTNYLKSHSPFRKNAVKHVIEISSFDPTFASMLSPEYLSLRNRMCRVAAENGVYHVASESVSLMKNAIEVCLKYFFFF